MTYTIKFATQENEIKRIKEFLYQIRVVEMGQYENEADHENSIFSDVYDRTATHIYAEESGQIKGSIKVLPSESPEVPINWPRNHELERFTSTVPMSQICYMTRLAVSKELRKGNLGVELVQQAYNLLLYNNFDIVLGDCMPHLLNFYKKLGFVPYKSNVNDSNCGILMPLVAFPRDMKYLNTISSPIAEVSYQYRDQNLERKPNWFALSKMYSFGELEREKKQVKQIHKALESRNFMGTNLLPNFTESEFATLFQKRIEIHGSRGEYLIKRGATTRTIFFIIAGQVEVKIGDKAIATIGSGEMVGEMNYILDVGRTSDVVISEDNTEIIGLSEGTIQRLQKNQPELAYKLLLFISRVLCARLVESND